MSGSVRTGTAQDDLKQGAMLRRQPWLVICESFITTVLLNTDYNLNMLITFW